MLLECLIKSAPHFFEFSFEFFFEFFIFYFLKIIHATCHISIVPRVKSVKVSRVKSLSESQFGPYIYYFGYISVHLF